jgi:hypothetical protein
VDGVRVEAAPAGLDRRAVRAVAAGVVQRDLQRRRAAVARDGNAEGELLIGIVLGEVEADMGVVTVGYDGFATETVARPLRALAPRADASPAASAPWCSAPPQKARRRTRRPK